MSPDTEKFSCRSMAFQTDEDRAQGCVQFWVFRPVSNDGGGYITAHFVYHENGRYIDGHMEIDRRGETSFDAAVEIIKEKESACSKVLEPADVTKLKKLLDRYNYFDIQHADEAMRKKIDKTTSAALHNPSPLNLRRIMRPGKPR